jgi:hypothetical protein
MATHQSKAQKETVERVMHEFKHGELKTSRGQKGQESETGDRDRAARGGLPPNMRAKRRSAGI